MKKFVVCVLAALLVLGLSGCSGGAPSTDPTNSSSTDIQTSHVAISSIYPHNASKYFDTVNITPPPAEIFTTSSDKNGLEGNVYALEGTVTKIESVADTDTFAIYLQTANGEVIILNIREDFCNNPEDLYYINPSVFREFFPNPSINEKIRIYAEYSSNSSPQTRIYFTYGGTDYIQTAFVASINSSN